MLRPGRVAAAVESAITWKISGDRALWACSFKDSWHITSCSYASRIMAGMNRFARAAGMDLPTATLGMMAGGSAAVVACADELEADPRRVASCTLPHWTTVGRGDQLAG